MVPDDKNKIILKKKLLWCIDNAQNLGLNYHKMARGSFVCFITVAHSAEICTCGVRMRMNVFEWNCE